MNVNIMHHQHVLIKIKRQKIGKGFQLCISPQKVHKWPKSKQKGLVLITFWGNASGTHNERALRNHENDCIFKKIKTDNIKDWQGCRAVGTLKHFWWECEWCGHCGKLFLKKLDRVGLYDSAVPRY